MMKLGLGEIGPWTFGAIRMIVGTLGLFACAALFGQRLGVPARDLRPLIVAAVLNTTGWQLLAAYGTGLMHAGRAAIVAFTMPLWATLLSALLLGERLTAPKLAGLALGLAGLALLVEREASQLGAAPLGIAFMLAAAVSWAAGSVAVKRHAWTMPAWPLTAWQMLIGGLPIVVGALAFEPEMRDLPALAGRVSWTALAATAYAATVPMIFCQWGWMRLLQIFPASLAAISTLMIPVVGVFASAVVLGEEVGGPELAALVCVVAGLALALRPAGAR